jgi:hypothetical protein
MLRTREQKGLIMPCTTTWESLKGDAHAMVAPVQAAVGAIVAMLKDCTLEVERVDEHIV